MKKYFPGRIIFDHLQKTAGQSVNAWLIENLGSRCVTPNLDGSHRSLISKYGGKYSVISGHLSFDGEDLDPRYDYVTLLREPLERALSWVYFVASQDRDNMASVGQLNIWEDANELIASNGDADISESFKKTLTNPYLTHFSSITNSHLKTLSDAEQFEEAKSNIERFCLFGFTERIDRFLIELSGILQLNTTSELGSVNKNHLRPKLCETSDSLLNRLKKYCEGDTEFYHLFIKAYEKKQKLITLPKVSRWDVWNENTDIANRENDALSLITALIERASELEIIQAGEHVEFVLRFSLYIEVPELECGIHIIDSEDNWAFGTNTTLLKRARKNVPPGENEIRFCIQLSLPMGTYTAGFGIAYYDDAGNRHELAWYEKLIEFQIGVKRERPSVGYAALPVTVFQRQLQIVELEKVNNATGTIFVESQFNHAITGEILQYSLNVHNTSDEHWGGSQQLPIYLEWEIVDTTNKLIDSQKSTLPVLGSGLAPGKTDLLQVDVTVPEVSSAIKLKFFLRQVGNRNFEEIGLLPGIGTLEVNANNSVRRYLHSDSRLLTQVGMRGQSSLRSDHAQGFLLFGPYASLCKGNWRCTLEGMFSPMTGEIIVDLVHSSATICIKKKSLVAAQTTVSFTFCLDEPVSDFELRVWVDERAQVEIYNLTVEKGM